MPFTCRRLQISGLVLFTPRRFDDERGWFMETFKESAFRDEGVDVRFVQDNCSLSAKRVVRGLHLQIDSRAQGKLIWAARGRVWDVAVDIRPDSPTLGRWEAVELDDESRELFYIPPGFAHGFLALSDDTLLQYKCTAEYDAASERGIRYDDRDLAIRWPEPNPVLSDRDRQLPTFAALMDEVTRAGSPDGSR